ncbi:MAG TPA: hypothetical protein VN756_08875 [Solirubrobacterales bacterium]|nr:hypothetical protein [Solirubrobacterales bacterium]
MALIGTEELAALSEVAESLYNSRIEIFHQSDEDQSGSWDDSVEGAQSDEPDEVVLGWFRNQPDYQTNDSLAAITHEEDGRLFVPLGTALERRDSVKVYALDADGNTVGDGTSYRVIDTNVENTWKVLIRAALRKIS